MRSWVQGCARADLGGCVGHGETERQSGWGPLCYGRQKRVQVEGIGSSVSERWRESGEVCGDKTSLEKELTNFCAVLLERGAACGCGCCSGSHDGDRI